MKTVTATLNPRDAIGSLYALLAMCEKSTKENDATVDGFVPELFGLARSVAEGILVGVDSAETEVGADE